MSMQVSAVTGALGAEIAGVDLARPLEPAVVDELRRAWLDHQVLLFRDQTLTPQQFLAFARAFGEPIPYPFVKGIDGCPEVIEVKKLEHETVNFGGLWHTDTAYLERPPMASLLLAREVPAHGGDTLFADMYRAYETLSDGLKRLLGQLRALNTSAKAEVSGTREHRIDDSAADARAHCAEHPVVRTHPETGRRALYVNTAHTLRFVDMTEAESAPLLDYLFRHQVQAAFTCRLRWRPGTLALWDNRCTQHYPLNDYQGQRRVMHRIILAGDRPR